MEATAMKARPFPCVAVLISLFAVNYAFAQQRDPKPGELAEKIRKIVKEEATSEKVQKGTGQIRWIRPTGSAGGTGRTDLYFDGRQDEGRWDFQVLTAPRRIQLHTAPGQLRLEGKTPEVYWMSGKDGRWEMHTSPTKPSKSKKAKSKEANKRRKQTSKIL